MSATEAFQTLCQHFDNHDLSYQAVPEENVVKIHNFSMDNGAYSGFGRAEDDMMMVTLFAPFNIREGCRPTMAEAANRINERLIHGRFSVDYDDGSLDYRVSSFFDGSLTDPVIRDLIVTALSTIDRYVPTFLSIIYGNEEPKDAIQQVWAGLESE